MFVKELIVGLFINNYEFIRYKSLFFTMKVNIKMPANQIVLMPSIKLSTRLKQ